MPAARCWPSPGAGLFGRRERLLRLLLAAWTGIALAVTFGAPGLDWLVRTVPGLRETALFRYLPASWILCLCVLAGLALDDLLKGGRPWRIAVSGLALAGLCAVLLQQSGAAVAATRLIRDSTGLAAACSILLVGLTLLPRVSAGWRVVGLTTVLVTEAIVWFGLPTLFYPRKSIVELAGVGFLQSHVGLQRIMAVETLSPNYGSYFGIPAINHDDLPIPRAWVEYIRAHLDANAPPILFDGYARADPTGPSAADELLRNQANYAAVGVRYVVAPLRRTFPELQQVFQDRAIRVYELPGTAAYVSAPGCRLDVRSRTELSASCDAPAALVRLELNMPGWRAWVNGVPARVTTTGEIFQSVSLPVGTSDVRFAFEPPFMRLGCAALGLGLLLAALGARRGRAAPRRKLQERTS